MKRILALLITQVICVTFVFSQNDHIKELENKIENNDAEAMCHLGIHYMDGDAVDLNCIKGLSLIRKASLLGSDNAKEYLKELTDINNVSWGDAPFEGFYTINFNEWAETIIKKYADKNSIGAKILMAWIYQNNGKYKDALNYYEYALRNINSRSTSEETLLKQLAEELTFEDGFELFRLELDCITGLARMYEKGKGVTRNLKKALDLYSIPGDYYEYKNPEVNENGQLVNYNNNNFDAVGQAYDGMVPYPANSINWNKIKELAAKLHKLSDFTDLDIDYTDERLDMQHAPNILWSGEIYYQGYSGVKDYKKAHRYFMAVTKSVGPWDTPVWEYFPSFYADACYRLYQMYKDGIGCERNLSKANNYFNIALQYGSRSAIFDDQTNYEKVK